MEIKWINGNKTVDKWNEQMYYVCIESYEEG